MAARVRMRTRPGDRYRRAFHLHGRGQGRQQDRFRQGPERHRREEHPLGRPVCVLDCDLASSVKSSDFAKAFPDHFFQGGVQEHNTATVAGALSTMGIVSFFADFGAFGMDETYNQQRLNDINKTNLKLVLTHLGLDVGQDGKTHQCIDYIGLGEEPLPFQAHRAGGPEPGRPRVRYVAATGVISS